MSECQRTIAINAATNRDSISTGRVAIETSAEIDKASIETRIIKEEFAMRSWTRVCLMSLGVLVNATPVYAYTNIQIDLSTQTMHVHSSRGSFAWPVSTARAGYVTPRGSYSPKSLQPMHYSRKYQMSPMPHSIFFAGGYAIHGSYATGALGRPASHGCVRLSPEHASQLYEMVRSEGGHITITGRRPSGYTGVVSRGSNGSYASNYRYSRRQGGASAQEHVDTPFGDLFSW